MKNPIVVIAGPTASGKTDMAIALAKKFDGEVINADSRSIYRGMNIGTSTPTRKEMKGISHHLFSFINPDGDFSVAEYKKLAIEKINKIQDKKKLPFLVGGTGLYIDAVVYDYKIPKGVPDKKLRERLGKKSLKQLLQELKRLDLKTFDTIDQGNKRRIIRALEVCIQTGRPFSGQKTRIKLPFNILYLAIDISRQKLYEKIKERAETWLKRGFLREVKQLAKKYPAEIPAMSGIGYKQFALYLSGKIYFDEAKEKLAQGDRNLAKRQLTWFRRNRDIKWVKDKERAEKLIRGFLDDKKN